MTFNSHFNSVISCVTRRHNSSVVTCEHGADESNYNRGWAGGCGRRSDGEGGSGDGGGGRGREGGRDRGSIEKFMTQDGSPDLQANDDTSVVGETRPSQHELYCTYSTRPKKKHRARFAPDVVNDKQDAEERETVQQGQGQDGREAAVGLGQGGSAGRPAERSQPPGPGAHLEPCLGTLDLISLGVGSCLGTGMYLTTGMVANKLAGPGGVISFVLAGLASGLTGLCYAELAGLCPNTSGSAYMYAYVTVGELVAFIIGWGLIVEYVIGTAAGAVALSETIDSLCHGAFSFYTDKLALVFRLPKLDLVAAAVCTVLTLLLASGVRMSARVNNGLNLVNMAVLLFFLVASLCLGSPSNWVAGGFFPFGAAGVVKAIPFSYYAYIGFDSVAAAAEEARNPVATVPRSLLLSILLSCLAYVIVILALTFDLPYNKLDPMTAAMDVLGQLQFLPGQYVVAAGAVSGEFAATFGSMFPLPRVLATMATDGLIFRPLGQICPKRHTPLRATVVSGVVAIVMATFVDIKLLIDLVLIGTLLAYILVSFALLYMRYIEFLSQPASTSVTTATSARPETRLGQVVLYDPHGRKRSAERAGESAIGFLTTTTSLDVPVVAISTSTTSSSKPLTEGTQFQHRAVLPAVKGPSSEEGLHLARGDASHVRSGALSVASQQTLKPCSTASAQAANKKNSDREESSDSGSEPSDETVVLYEQTVAATASSRLPPSDDDADDDEERLLKDSPVTEAGAEVDSEGGQVRGRSKRRNRCGSNGLWSQLLLLFPGWCSGKGHPRDRTFHHRHHHHHPRAATSRLLRVVADVVGRMSATRARVVSLLCAVYAVIALLCLVVALLWPKMADGSLAALLLLAFLSALLLFLVAVLCFLPQTLSGNSFHAPLVPALPVFVALINIYLIIALSPLAWLMFGVWMTIGLLVYFLYGIRHSQASQPRYTPVVLLLDTSIDDDEDIAEEKEGDFDDVDDNGTGQLIHK